MVADDEKGLMMKYFVLSPTKDDAYGSASRAAIRQYARAIETTNPTLADDLRKWADDLMVEVKRGR